MRNIKNGHKIPVVCLDAGHYGKYNKSPVEPTLYESEFNWMLQEFLARELELVGISAITTRQDRKVDMDLVKRGEMAKDCDLFLSLHANASSDPKVDYVLGIYFIDDDCGDIDKQSKEIATLLSDAVAEVMGTSGVAWNRASVKDRDGNGHLDDYYGVLRGAHNVKTTGVILEHGFYTNPKHAQILSNEDKVRELARLEAKVLAQWFDVDSQVVGNPCTVKLHSLKKGCRGEAVEALQALLISKGYPCGEQGIDGRFGAMTDKAVRSYQSDMELEVDGSAGPITLRSLMGYR